MSSFALVCASTFSSEDFISRYRNKAFDQVVAVDSGLAHLESISVKPDVILGDFDSLGYVPQGALVHPAIKDKSDLELAIDHAIEHGADDMIIYGCLGGRLDHTMAALQNIAAAAEAGIRIRAIDQPWGENEGANNRLRRFPVLEAITGPRKLSLHAQTSAAFEQVEKLGAPTFGSISVFAATDQACGVTEQGMYYPLEQALLTNRTSLGLSNELVKKEGSVSVQKGTVFVLYPADLLTALS